MALKSTETPSRPPHALRRPLPADEGTRRPHRLLPDAATAESGIGLLVTVILLFVLSMLSATLVTLGEADIAVSDNYRSSLTALYLADSGLEGTAGDLQDDLADPLDNWLNAWIDTSASPPQPYDPFPDLEGTEINDHTLTSAEVNSAYAGTAYAVGGATGLGDGSYGRTIWVPPTVTPQGANGNTFRVDIQTRSVGNDASASAPSAVVVDALLGVDVTLTSPWNNAAFLCSGNAGQLVSGAFKLAGSLHAIGDAAAPPELDMSAGSMQINNYDGIDDPSYGFGTLATKIPALGTTEFNDETVTSLDGVFRLKDATVYLGDYGSLGEADVSGDGDKETLDAIWSNDPVDTSSSDGGGGDSGGLIIDGGGGGAYADESGPYDLPDDTSCPRLTDSFTDPETGQTYSTYADWLTENSYSLPAGDLEIDYNTADFSYSDPDGKGSISWDATNKVLTVDGIVKVDGEVRLAPNNTPKGLSAIQYRGTGVIYSTSNIKIHKNLVPEGQYLQDGSDLDSQIDGNLGLIAAADIRIGFAKGDPNVKVMAALYAADEAELGDSSQVAGAVAANFLRASGSGAPGIWQVPRLAKLAPRGMPPGRALSISGVSVTGWYQRR